MKAGIRLKLFLLSLALIGISVVAVEIYLSRALEQQLSERIQGDLLVRARLVAERLAASPLSLQDLPAADATADSMGRSANVRVTLIRRDGVVAGDSEVSLTGLATLENHGSRPEVMQTFAQGQGITSRYSATLSRRLMYAGAPIVRDGQTIGVARVALPLTEIDNAIAEMDRSLLAGALLALAVAIIMSVSVAQLTSRKLLELTEVAREMAAGNLAARTRLSGHDEIVALGNALDQLADSLTRSLGELRAERDLLTGILFSMNEGVLVVGADGRVVLTNPALRAMLLVGPDAIGKSVLQVIRNADLNQVLEQASRGGQEAEVELELSGLRPRRVLVRVVTLRDAPGGVLAVFVDVTELRRLEAVRRDFVANASHELRSPLTSVRAAAETLSSGDNDPTATARFIGLIQRNAERLGNLIDDLLELSRIESRELKLELEPVELGSVVERSLGQHAHRAQLKGITVRSEPTRLPIVRADRRALEHVLSNLIDNALKYCPNGASIRISTAVLDDHVRVSVSDTGPGIPAEHLPRLFERFYRVDPGRSRELGGTGLGLSIVKHLVESMGGSVSVESRIGAGTTFSFTLRKA